MKNDYNANKKIATAMKKERRKEMIKNGEKDKLNLNFFTTIINAIEIPYFELAKRTGFSQQLISWWISTDDCKFSNIIKVFESFDIKISPSFEPKNPIQNMVSNEEFRIEIENLPMLLKKKEKNELLISCIRKQGRLAFLAQFIIDQNHNLVSFSSAIGIDYNTLYRWFVKDDIKISALTFIARKIEHKIVWRLSPLHDDKIISPELTPGGYRNSNI